MAIELGDLTCLVQFVVHNEKSDDAQILARLHGIKAFI